VTVLEDDRSALALQALAEVTDPASVGELIEVAEPEPGVRDLVFACRLPGYVAWRWIVSTARIGDAAPTVLEVELLPGEGALVAPPWVPWAERLAEWRRQHPDEHPPGEPVDDADEADETDDAEHDDESDLDEDDLAIDDGLDELDEAELEGEDRSEGVAQAAGETSVDDDAPRDDDAADDSDVEVGSDDDDDFGPSDEDDHDSDDDLDDDGSPVRPAMEDRSL
jgi:DUF3027 family protein